MEKDKRYTTASQLYESGHIKSFKDFLEIIPKTVVARDLRIHHKTFDRLTRHPEGWTLGQLFNMAALMGIDKMAMVMVVLSIFDQPKDQINNMSLEAVY